MARGSTPRQGLAGAVSRHPRAGIAGALVGLAAAGTAAGVAVSRMAGRRVRAEELGAARLPDRTDAQLREDDPLGLASRTADRSAVVQTDDGVLLSVEEIGPRDAPLTVVFVHGYTLSMASWTFQRRTLGAELATANGHRPDARLVFYDQRGHGDSSRGDGKRSTIEQLACDLEPYGNARAVSLVSHPLDEHPVRVGVAVRPQAGTGASGRQAGQPAANCRWHREGDGLWSCPGPGGDG